ncbi:glycosyltransferase [Lentibacillus sp. N15]|uniref:glycosyltransferase n=1 Tax=Lentibacillus songyuanensis TaxID=3136161 RepID=UPI0031BB9DB9
MKTKIVFMVINMNVGGTEKSLLNLIATLPEDKYEITIVMLEKCGGFLPFIPKRVHVHYIDEYPKIRRMIHDPPKKVMKQLVQEKQFIKILTFTTVLLLSKVLKRKNVFLNYVLKNTPDLEGKYDVAMAYAGPMDLISYFIIKKVNAKRKVQWVHFDVTKIGFDKQFATTCYRSFDRILVVSNEGKDILTSTLPRLFYKIGTYINPISSDLIIKMANSGEGFEQNSHFNGVRILTVGRLCNQKGQDLAIPVLARLKEAGFSVKWYCIGEGSARRNLEERIKKYGIEKEFILLGTKINPYPYMKQCDLYVQPSRHEGYCITLAEAKCFDKPIISTNFTGVHEHITHEKTGLVVSFDYEEVYTAIKRVIGNGLRINPEPKTAGDRQ